MKEHLKSIGSLGLLVFLASSYPAITDNYPRESDNSRVNERDRNRGQVTAQEQSGNETDLEITRKIRKGIVDRKSFSTYAHNIKVVTINGVTTLKGPVRTQREIDEIMRIAENTTHRANIKNELEVVSAE